MNESRHRSVLYVLDFDRCLGNTSVIVQQYRQLAAELNVIGSDQLREAQLKSEASGGSFDLIGYMEQSVASVDLDRLNQEFIARAAPQELLNEGASDLLSTLQQQAIPHAIVTFGSLAWQTLKLRATGLEQSVPYIVITDKAGKGKLIASWYRNGVFQTPASIGGASVQQIVMVDDKASEFAMLPEAAHGYLLRLQADVVLPVQQGEIPTGVMLVHSFKDIMAREGLDLT